MPIPILASKEDYYTSGSGSDLVTPKKDSYLPHLRWPSPCKYGLKQAGRQWKKKLEEMMRELGFRKSAVDDCLFIKEENGVLIIVVLVYVDDMAVASPKLADVISFKQGLGK
jgi:hypothetical protein